MSRVLHLFILSFIFPVICLAEPKDGFEYRAKWLGIYHLQTIFGQFTKHIPSEIVYRTKSGLNFGLSYTYQKSSYYNASEEGIWTLNHPGFKTDAFSGYLRAHKLGPTVEYDFPIWDWFSFYAASRNHIEWTERNQTFVADEGSGKCDFYASGKQTTYRSAIVVGPAFKAGDSLTFHIGYGPHYQLRGANSIQFNPLGSKCSEDYNLFKYMNKSGFYWRGELDIGWIF